MKRCKSLNVWPQSYRPWSVSYEWWPFWAPYKHIEWIISGTNPTFQLQQPTKSCSFQARTSPPLHVIKLTMCEPLLVTNLFVQQYEQYLKADWILLTTCSWGSALSHFTIGVASDTIVLSV